MRQKLIKSPRSTDTGRFRAATVNVYPKGGDTRFGRLLALLPVTIRTISSLRLDVLKGKVLEFGAL